MKFNPRFKYALALIAAVLLVSCGGGGAQNNPNQGGTLSILPSGGTFYAGVAYTITLSGGHGPYALSSDEADVLPVPAIVNGNTFQVVANNPGVIDTGLPPGALPVRTVNITARDSTGQGPVSAAIKVAQNFLTSYTLDFPATTCSLPTTVTTITPCAGGDTIARVQATVNGNLQGLMQFQFDVVSGTMGFVNPLGSNTVTQSYVTQTDHQGTATAVVRVPAGTPAQVGAIRVTATASGVNTLYTFIIQPGVTSPLTATPPSFTFTGSASGQCGNGSGSFIVTGGTAPYHAISSDPNLSVVQAANSGTFTLTYSNPTPPCATGSTIIVTDSAGSTPAQVTVTSTAGATVAPTALTVSPSSVSLTCGGSAAVTVVGGTGTYSASSTAPGYLTETVSGHTVTITRRGDDTTNPSLASTSQTVNITDGASIAPVTVNAGSVHCP